MVKNLSLQCRRPGFNVWVRKMPWRWEWLPTPVFLPGEFHGQRSLAGYTVHRVTKGWTHSQLSRVSDSEETGWVGSSPGTTSVHTLATPPTTSRPRIRPHFCRKSPSARAQIPNVVASSSAEMAPAAFTCSATSCERARLSPGSRWPQRPPRGGGTSPPSSLCLPVSALTSRGPDFPGVSPPSSAHPQGPPR